MKQIYKTTIALLTAMVLFAGCCSRESAQECSQTDPKQHSVYNPYPSGATIPVNICPINISYLDRATTIIVLADSTGKIIETHKQYFSKTFNPSIKKWRKWLEKAYKGQIEIKHSATTHIYYIAEPIDPYISYRKTLFNEDHRNMFIEERDITNFKEKKLIISSTGKDTTNTCINCHNTRNNNGNYCLIHVRHSFDGQVSKYSGTYLFRNGEIIHVNPQWGALKAFNKLVYYDFHPTKELIAFSTNTDGHAEMFVKNGLPDDYMWDTLGIIILYNIKTNSIITSKDLSDEKYEYSFPVWNKSGTELYFVRGIKQSHQKPWNFLFDLCRIFYDTITNSFGKAEIIFPFSQCGVSVTMPRQIPGTNKLLVTVHRTSGSIPQIIDGDLYIIDLDSTQNTAFQIGINTLAPNTFTLPPNKYAKITEAKKINTLNSERWHNFSSDGRWMVFSSARLAGEQSYPHIVYIDKTGNFSKPLAMPQKDPLFFTKNAWSYIIPNVSKISADFENRKAAELYLQAAE